MTAPISTLVMDLYEEIETLTTAFRSASHLTCSPGCGECCTSVKVEATLLELIPIAEELWRTGAAEQWLAKATSAATNTCVFYNPNELCHGQGRCSIYPWRPLICRLFGFAAVRMRSGELEMTICSFIRSLVPEAKEQADALAESGFAIPVFSDASMKLLGIEPHLGTTQLPINKAIAQAIERVGLTVFLQSQDSLEVLVPGSNDRAGGPLKPHRAA